ncbi:MAG: sigma 54-interacting transcriptional regulator [Hyalangium sp.]|uniref:sigma 54-interacting transcriptional regulator n=1 Tax=Hyalangium sp. TaxID=2028555 RepID=UPI00389A2156
MPELVFFRRGQELLRVTLGRTRLVLGRGDNCDVVIPDPSVSRQQVALHFDGTRCLLEDLSGQGTEVAGQPLKHGELPDGADLSLGPWRALFRLHSSGTQDGPTGVGPRTAVQPRGLPQATPSPAQLRVKQGTTEFVHELRGDSLTLGKEASNTVVLQDQFISNRHLKVTRKDEGFHVVDLNSTNGTFLGPVRIFEAKVPLNTVLRLGETELIFEPVSQGRPRESFHGIIGKEPSMRQLVERIQQVAPSTVAVAILGESGTGKELVARAVHECSPRAAQPFIPINCAALSPQLIESELFGHEKGAFTGADVKRKGAFEEADGGTLFLDELGELPLELQAKLLRVLENGEAKPVGATRPIHVDVRVVAATNQDLRAQMRAGKFREDLYYRLCGMSLVLPTLRSRPGDVRALAEHFLRVLAPLEQTVRFSIAALDKLEQHIWPGNVRELRNVVQRALLLRKGPRIDVGELTFEEAEPREPEGLADLELPVGVTLEQMLQRVERQLIENALRRFKNNRDRTARVLGMGRSSLYRRLKALGLDSGDEEAG